MSTWKHRTPFGKIMVISIIPVSILLLFTNFSCTVKRSEKNTIKFMCWGDVYNRMFNEKIKTEFNKQKQPSFNLELSQPVGRAYFQKLVTLSAAGALPDVVLVVDSQLKMLAAKKAILPLDKYLEDPDFIKIKNDYWPGVLEGGQWEDKLYGIPIWTWTYGIYYNKEIFDKFGVSYPEKGWTWDDFMEKAKAATDTTNPRDKYYGFTGLGRGMKNAFVTDYLFRNIGDIYNADRTKCLIDTPEAIDAIKWYFDILHKAKAVPTSADTESMERQTIGGGFLIGRIAMKAGGRDQLDVHEKGNIKFRYGVVHMPFGKYDKGIQTTVYLVISANCKNPDNAWEFLKFCGGYEGQKIVTADRSDITVLKSMTNSPEYINYLGKPDVNIAFREMMEQTKPVPFVEGQEEWLDYTKSVFELMELKRISIEQGCHDMANSYIKMVVENAASP